MIEAPRACESAGPASSSSCAARRLRAHPPRRRRCRGGHHHPHPGGGAKYQKIVAVPAGGELRDVAGPLGQPTEIENWGRVVCVGGGAGTAVLYPLAKALAKAGNHLVSIIGGRSDKYVILHDELAEISREVYVTTEDGSRGETGFVTVPLKRMLEDPAQRPAAVYAVGPVPMMKAVSSLTREYGVKTIVSLNPIMVDGTGMCGGCRVTVGGEVKFACVDGPEFDGHEVDYDELFARQATYPSWTSTAAGSVCRRPRPKPPS